MADHMGFSYTYVHTTFDGTDTFTTTNSANTSGKVYRIEPPPGQAKFYAAQDVADLLAAFGIAVDTWGSGSEALLISMTITDITATTAKGSGSFTVTDVDGDTLSGIVSGTWVRENSRAAFTGGLGNVTFTSNVNGTFDGHIGGMSMVFSEPAPWSGTVVQLNAGNGWFTQSFSADGGSIDAMLPVPGAVLLGMLGLSVAGMKLRKFA